MSSEVGWHLTVTSKPLKYLWFWFFKKRDRCYRIRRNSDHSLSILIIVHFWVHFSCGRFDKKVISCIQNGGQNEVIWELGDEQSVPTPPFQPLPTSNFSLYQRVTSEGQGTNNQPQCSSPFQLRFYLTFVFVFEHRDSSLKTEVPVVDTPMIPTRTPMGICHHVTVSNIDFAWSKYILLLLSQNYR